MSLRDRLSRYAEGVHRLGEPGYVLDAGLPAGLLEVYRQFDGGELFHEALVLWPSSKIDGSADRIAVGEVDGDDLFIARKGGAVWRREQDSGDWLQEGSAFERWLLGWVDAQEVLFDDEGEYRDDVFDDDGELVPEAAVRFERRLLKRDRAAPAPRWRLARALTRSDQLDAARDELEEAVALHPRFAWAWYDLARLSERLGDLAGATDELREAAACDTDYAGFFWAHVARVAVALGDDGARAEAAARALAAGPQLVESHRDAAAASLDDDDLAAAAEHQALAAALAPRDLQVLELGRRIGRPSSGTGSPDPTT